MNDLGPDARSIVETARGAETLPGDNRKRIKHAVLVQVATLGAATGATGGAFALSAVTKVTLLAVAATVVGGGSYSLWAWKTRATAPVTTTTAQSHGPAQPVTEPPAPVIFEKARPKSPVPEARRRDGARGEARRPALGPAPAFESASEPSPAPVAPGVPRASTPVPSVSAPAANRAIQSLSPELTILRQAQEDLRAGQPAQALRRLEEYDRRFIKGSLEQERQALEAIARCQMHLDPAAQARAERFLRQAPESPLAERVRAACTKSEKTGRLFDGNE